MPSLLATSLTTLTKAFHTATKVSREDYEASELSQFLTYKHDPNHGILKLCAVIPAYAECMKAVGVTTRAELEQLWTKHGQEPDVKEAVEKLLQAEKELNEFVDEIDAKINPSEDKLTLKNGPPPNGQPFPDLNSLIEIPSGEPAALETFYKKAKFTLFVFLRLLG